MTQIPDGFRWSFSSLTTFSSCKRRFYLQYIERQPQEDNPFSQYGTFAHGLIEGWAKGEIPDFALAEEYKRGYDEAVTKPWPPFPKNMPEKYYTQGLAYFQNFSGFGDQYEIIAVEDKFCITLDEHRIIGLADLVLRDKNTGEITVVDHKSKTSTSMQRDLQEYRRQLYIYAMYVKEKFGVWPAYLKFNLFRENKWVSESFSLEALEETKQWILSTIAAAYAETEWPERVDDYFCRNLCGVLFHCPLVNDILYPPSRERKRGK